MSPLAVGNASPGSGSTSGTLGDEIQELGLIANETQMSAKVLRWTLRDLERELTLSAFEDPQEDHPRTGLASGRMGDALSDRIHRLKVLGNEVNGLLQELVEELRKELAVRSRLADPGSSPRDLRTQVEEYERTLITAALRAGGGSQRLAASALGILPTTLHEKLGRLGLRALVKQRARRIKHP